MAQENGRVTVNKQFSSEVSVENPGITNIGSPEEVIDKLGSVGYHCLNFIGTQLSLVLTTPIDMVRAFLLEGPPGCGKSYLAKSLAKVTGAELMCLSCYKGMNLQHLIEVPSSLAIASAMAGKQVESADQLMNLGVLSRAFLTSQTKPVILLIDELDKVDGAIDTFFLGPLQDARIWLESRPPIDANIDNLLVIFTKNYDRQLGDALLRRVHPINMQFLDTTLEKKVLAEHCLPKLVDNLIAVADLMRHNDGSYKFDRAPAPEELLKIGRYVLQLLEWDINDFAYVGRIIWFNISKSDHDRTVLEQMVRYHPGFFDSLCPDGRKASIEQTFARLGRRILEGVVKDPEASRRAIAYKAERVGLTGIGSPERVVEKLGEVGYQSTFSLASQIALVLNTSVGRVRALMLEGPPGCGKSFMAKCLAKVTGADFMCLSCYMGMNTSHLIESPSTLAMANVMSGKDSGSAEKLMNLGILSRAFMKSQTQPIILLIDEIDKVEVAIDTFFLGPIQDSRIWLESRPPIDANIDNLLLIFTKNFVRVLNDALLRRVHPIRMTYLDSTLERKILAPYCNEILIRNLSGVADRMRYNNGSYAFERPPAPEELLTAGHYIQRLIEWGQTDFAFVGESLSSTLAKSEHDRAVLDHMLRFHPDFMDPLVPDGRNAKPHEIFSRLGRLLLKDIVDDPDERRREEAWENIEYN